MERYPQSSDTIPASSQLVQRMSTPESHSQDESPARPLPLEPQRVEPQSMWRDDHTAHARAPPMPPQNYRRAMPQREMGSPGFNGGIPEQGPTVPQAALRRHSAMSVDRLQRDDRMTLYPENRVSGSRRSFHQTDHTLDEESNWPIQYGLISDQRTVDQAMVEEGKYSRKAQLTGWALNIAIGLQIILSALITGVSAATSGRQTSLSTSILGGIGTIFASYLARARGSNEPELSISRAKDLQKFIRDCDTYILDHGDELGSTHDHQIADFRTEFEDLLGNGSGERKLAPLI